jgi:glyoxylase-like metal-dependent hydrolase (beta-lactamase superfamily II)
MEPVQLPDHDVLGIIADNPGPFTLTGTNSWIVAREPAWLIDPGPELDAHLDAVSAEIDRRGGLGGIVLTHDHRDHAGALPEMRRRFAPVPVAAARGAVDVVLRDGDRFGPLEVIATPGHAADHLSFLADGVAFSGDAVLGTGSVFIEPDPGALRGYLEALTRLRARAPVLLAPGHGPLVTDPDAKLAEYIEHRLKRESSLLDALAAGDRTVDALLGAAWPNVPEQLRRAAALTLAAHLDKLAEEGRLPEGVERPEVARG